MQPWDRKAPHGFCARCGVPSRGAPRKLSGLPLASGQRRLLSQSEANVRDRLTWPGDSAGRRMKRSGRSRSPNRKQCFSSRRPNDPSSATRPNRGHTCNRSAMAGFAGAHG